MVLQSASSSVQNKAQGNRRARMFVGALSLSGYGVATERKTSQEGNGSKLYIPLDLLKNGVNHRSR